MATSEATQRKYELFAASFIEHDDMARAANDCGSKAKNLNVAGSKLLARAEVKKIIKAMRKDVAATPMQDVVALEGEYLEKQVIGLEEKRQFLWNLAHDCAEVQTIHEEKVTEGDDGSTTRVETTTKRVVQPDQAMRAIEIMNKMDGHGQDTEGDGEGFGIESLLMQIGIKPK